MRRRRLPAGILFLAIVFACRVGTTMPPGPVVVQAPQTSEAPPVALPNKDGSLKFGVLGDFGTGDREQYQLADQMAKLRTRFPYEIVITVGDNLYGSQRPQDFFNKFEKPYKALLDADVKFYASLGNHDDRAQARYKLFNMDGKRYYTFKAPHEDVRFFALESDYPVPDQIKWLEKELQDSGEKWKIPYFHHPLYSSGERHGSDTELRKALEPLFIKYGVSVVLTGHDHFYERVKPQNGIVYFVVGSGGKLRAGNIDRRSGLTAKGFDTDLAFMAVEIDGDEMFFNTISRQGTVIDSGVIQRRKQETDGTVRMPSSRP
jgi:3',5'-cyclic AMP phosphodiesterase CpdA